VQEAAYEAYANREFGRTVQLLSQLVDTDPQNLRWYEMRAQVGKQQPFLHVHMMPAAAATTTAPTTSNSVQLRRHR
jgi:hypothetical protein